MDMRNLLLMTAFREMLSPGEQIILTVDPGNPDCCNLPGNPRRKEVYIGLDPANGSVTFDEDGVDFLIAGQDAFVPWEAISVIRNQDFSLCTGPSGAVLREPYHLLADPLRGVPGGSG